MVGRRQQRESQSFIGNKDETAGQGRSNHLVQLILICVLLFLRSAYVAHNYQGSFACVLKVLLGYPLMVCAKEVCEEGGFKETNMSQSSKIR